MITVRPGRVRPTNRIDTPSDKPVTVRPDACPAPIKGMVDSNLAPSFPDLTAYFLENWWPTTEGLRVRSGLYERFDLTDTTPGTSGVETFFQYTVGGAAEFFAADANNVYEWAEADVDGTVLPTVLTGKTNGDWSWNETQPSSGNNFLTIVNGEDNLELYDGTSWQTVDGVSVPHAITGVDTDKFLFVWNYQSRQFFIEKNSLNAWYLGINSISGAANKLSLGSVFSEGGSLLFGGVVSASGGDGYDAKCVFVTNQGEAAVYTGTDPASVNTWELEGVYKIGTPLGKHAHFNYAGDLFILTDLGLVPLSTAMQVGNADNDKGVPNILDNIRGHWQKLVQLAGDDFNWKVSRSTYRNMVIIAPPTSADFVDHILAVNMALKAPCKITNWTVKSVAVMNDNIYIGGSDGKISLADTGGQDHGMPFVAKVAFAPRNIDIPNAVKTSGRVRATFESIGDVTAKLSVAGNLSSNFPAAPVASVPFTGASYWDTATWDVAEWSVSIIETSFSFPSTITGTHARLLSPQVQVTSDSVQALDIILKSFDMNYKPGGIMVV